MLDPIAAFSEFISQWEKGVNEFANRLMKSDEFAQTMNRATTTSATMQHQLGELTGRYLKMLNIPSRSEIADIGERLQTIETSLHRISAELEKLNVSGGRAVIAGPPRTRRPPSVQPSGNTA